MRVSHAKLGPVSQPWTTLSRAFPFAASLVHFLRQLHDDLSSFQHLFLSFMPSMFMDGGATAALAAGAAGAGAWLIADAGMGLSTDLKQMRRDQTFRRSMMTRIARLGHRASAFHMLEQCDPSAEALWFEGRNYLYRDVLQESTRLACILQTHGIAADDVVALFMTNSPEMIFSFFAVSQLGAVPAMINNALKADTLAHAINIAKPKLCVTTPDLTDAVCVAIPGLKTLSLNLGTFAPPQLVSVSSNHTQVSSICPLDLLQNGGRPDTVARTVRDIGALLYTSGTTGNPKAVAVKNFTFAILTTPNPEDSWQAKHEGTQSRTFTSLPLFHGTGLFGALISGLASSGCCCLTRKFSANNFSRQLTLSRATRMMYIGEIGRYMLAAAPSEFDCAHNCRIAWGNGMQKDVWLKFRKRFGIPYIREFYRSTEGQAKYENYLNLPGGEGFVGFRGLLGGWLEDDTFLVRVDETGKLLRDPRTGFCIKAHYGETGEAIGRVRSMDLFSEYLHNKAATNAKLVSNVFKRGDLFQRSGDLLLHQSNGWIRFQDRSGDTYRWMGENISASEVRSHILGQPQVQDALVYGKALKGYDGQVGCAALVLAHDFTDLEGDFLKSLPASLAAKGLAKHAIPRLLRIVNSIPTGSTFKHMKTNLAAESWDPRAASTGQRLYWLRGSQYEVLDSKSWSTIEEHKARL